MLGRNHTDFVAGELVGVLPYEIRNTSGNWKPYSIREEVQRNANGDTMACVSFSANNAIEMQIKYQTGVEINLSDRWLAKMSNTTPYGNWLDVVANTLRTLGAVEEAVWPAPPDYTWQTYYSSIPADIQARGAEFLKKWNIAYEWVPVSPESIRHHLKHAPLQVILPGHAVVQILNEADMMEYFDSYEPFIKRRAQNAITDALKIVLTPKEYTMAKVLNDNGTIRVEFGSGPSGFNIGIASSSLFQQIQASGEPILVQPASTPERMTLSDGTILHRK